MHDSCSETGEPLSLRERVGVRGSGLSIVRNPSPELHLAMPFDLSRKGRGKTEPIGVNDIGTINLNSSLRN
jgi:hypothetical protein